MRSTKWIRVLVFILAFGLVGLSVFPSVVDAQVRDPKLSDSQEPGSVIVFPKFIRGTVTVDGVVTPATEIEISVLCPKGVLCFDRQPVRLLAHWVCPGNAKNICKETDFILTTSVNGTVVFNPSRLGITAPCAQGYLIAWVVNAFNQPIKFDGLIGDAVLRNAGGSAAAYNGIPIQADPALLNGAPIVLAANGGLIFDGDPGHYLGVTGKALGSVRFDKLTAPLVSTFLTMLTLDVNSNRVNDFTYVDLLFWNSNEILTSTSTDFICWAEQQLSVDIDQNLTQESQLFPKGSFVGQAEDPLGIPRTLLMIVETQERNAAGGLEREYSYSTYNDSTLVPTTFVPN